MRYRTVIRDQCCLCRKLVVVSHHSFHVGMHSPRPVPPIKLFSARWLLRQWCQRTSCPNVSPRNTTMMSLVFSYLILLTPIVYYPDRRGDCETAAEVNRVINVVMRLTLHEPTK